MATHSSIHAWRILRTEEPGKLYQSRQGSDRTGGHTGNFHSLREGPTL